MDVSYLLSTWHEPVEVLVIIDFLCNLLNLNENNNVLFDFVTS